MKIAGPTIEFLGRASDEVMKKCYSECKALLFPGEEDFGITPLEAQASGRPVIAYGKGGALETVIDGSTGLFFQNQNAESLVEAMIRFDNMTFDKKLLREHAEKFDDDVFKEKIKMYVNEKVTEYHNQQIFERR